MRHKMEQDMHGDILRDLSESYVKAQIDASK